MELHRDVHRVRPVLEGHDPEQGEQRGAERAPVQRIVLAEEVHSGHRIDVEDHEEQQHHVPEPRQRPDEGRDDDPELGHHGDEAQHPKEARETRDERELAGIGNEGEDEDGEIEQVPPVPKVALEAGRDGRELDGGLEDEYRQGRLIDPADDGAEPGAQRLARIHAESDCRRQDHRDDDVVKRAHPHHAFARPLQSLHTEILSSRSRPAAGERPFTRQRDADGIVVGTGSAPSAVLRAVRSVRARCTGDRAHREEDAGVHGRRLSLHLH